MAEMCWPRKAVCDAHHTGTQEENTRFSKLAHRCTASQLTLIPATLVSGSNTSTEQLANGAVGTYVNWAPGYPMNNSDTQLYMNNTGEGVWINSANTAACVICGPVTKYFDKDQRFFNNTVCASPTVSAPNASREKCWEDCVKSASCVGVNLDFGIQGPHDGDPGCDHLKKCMKILYTPYGPTFHRELILKSPGFIDYDGYECGDHFAIRTLNISGGGGIQTCRSVCIKQSELLGPCNVAQYNHLTGICRLMTGCRETYNNLDLTISVVGVGLKFDTIDWVLTALGILFFLVVGAIMTETLLFNNEDEIEGSAEEDEFEQPSEEDNERNRTSREDKIEGSAEEVNKRKRTTREDKIEGSAEKDNERKRTTREDESEGCAEEVNKRKRTTREDKIEGSAEEDNERKRTTREDESEGCADEDSERYMIY